MYSATQHPAVHRYRLRDGGGRAGIAGQQPLCAGPPARGLQVAAAAGEEHFGLPRANGLYELDLPVCLT